MPACGGLVLGLLALGVARWRPRRAVDPIEANALYGGRMSLMDSLIVVLQTRAVQRRRRLGGAGGRLYPDRLGAGLPARAMLPAAAHRPAADGGLRRRRRIGGAFNAPLTGAFYAFELVIGTYTLATFAPVRWQRSSRCRWCEGSAGAFELRRHRARADRRRWTTFRSWRWAWSAR